MKKKILSTVICAVILCAMSIVANAAWTQLTNIRYYKGDNYTTGAPPVRKATDYNYNKMVVYNKTSWTTPRGEVVATNHDKMWAAAYPLNNGQEVRAFSYTEKGKVYNVYIMGAATQSGADYMDLKYDVDVP